LLLQIKKFNADVICSSNPSPAAMKNAEFVYQTNPAFFIFVGSKSLFPCDFNEKLLPHDRKDLAGALFMA